MSKLTGGFIKSGKKKPAGTTKKPANKKKPAQKKPTKEKSTKKTKSSSVSGGFITGGDAGTAEITKKLVNTECSLSKPNAEVCSSPEQIQDMAKMVTAETGKTAPKSEKAVVEAAKKVTGCKTESCLYSSSKLRRYMDDWRADQALQTNFKPIGPARTTALLSNVDIDEIGQNMAAGYPCHTHLNFEMIDFDQKNTQLARVDLINLLTSASSDCSGSRRTMSCVINTDHSSGGGLHWFCVFVEADIKAKRVSIEYFNTSGRLPRESVWDWMNKHNRNFRNAGWTSETKQICTTCIQDDNHSCGVWSLCYIWARLEKIPSNWFKPGSVTDDDMLQLRKHLFRDE